MQNKIIKKESPRQVINCLGHFLDNFQTKNSSFYRIANYCFNYPEKTSIGWMHM